MDENVGTGAGSVTIVEWSLRALTADPSKQASAGQCPTSLSRTLSWGALPPAAEGPLPVAVVTWPGHARVVAEPVVTAAAVGPADAGERGPDAVAGAAGAADRGPVAVAVAVAGASAGAAAWDAAGLGGLPVGGGLLDVLAGVDVAGLDDAGLLDVAARWQEVISWAIASQSRALGEIGRRRGWTEEHTAAAAEISARLRVPQDEANKHLARGAGLAEHPEVADALRRGVIDVAKADILLRAGNPLTTEERAQAIALYLPQAPERTRRWLRDKMNEFANGLKGATEVVKHARSRRAVFLDPADNAMAWLSANLPATDAAAVWDAVEQAAHALRRAPGGTRTLAQARADALVAITTGRIIVPPTPECAPEPAGTALPNSTSTANDRPGIEQAANEQAANEQAANEQAADEQAADGEAATSQGVIEEAVTGAGEGTGEGAFEGSTSAGVTSSTETPDVPALPRTTVPATGCTCGGCTCGGTTIRVVPVKPQIRITIPATTLLGLDDAPGRLDGYGPIPADLAAQIATDATWQRLLTDPVTGILTDYSTTAYQPGKILRQAVIARDQSCGFLQCDRPGHFADLDHIVPYDHDLDPKTQPPGTPGQTRAANLQPLCRAHHLAKTHHGWTPVRDPDTGITTWTAPTGHVYTRPATQVGKVSNDTTSLADDTRARLGQPPLTSPATTPPTVDSETTDDPNPHVPSANGPRVGGDATDTRSADTPTATAPATDTRSAPPLTTEQRLLGFPDEPPF
ncbi:HNH endonuclease [Promicromonospora soli]